MKSEREPGSSEPSPREPGPSDPGAGLAEAALRSLMAEQAVVIHGAVRKPGTYPVDGLVRLEMLLAAKKEKVPPTEDYAVVRADMVNRLLESFRTYVSASRGRAAAIAARRALVEGISAAFYRGFKTGGGF